MIDRLVASIIVLLGSTHLSMCQETAKTKKVPILGGQPTIYGMPDDGDRVIGGLGPPRRGYGGAGGAGGSGLYGGSGGSGGGGGGGGGLTVHGYGGAGGKSGTSLPRYYGDGSESGACPGTKGKARPYGSIGGCSDYHGIGGSGGVGGAGGSADE